MVSLSVSFVVAKMDPNHNEGASGLHRSDRVWEHLNIPFFPAPPSPIEITQRQSLPSVQIQPPAQNPQQPPPLEQILQQPSQPTQVNAPLFHIPQPFTPPLGSKIKILINELVQVDNSVCYNTLSLMNVLDQNLFGIANCDDTTEVRVTFQNGIDPAFKKVFLDMARKGKKFTNFVFVLSENGKFNIFCFF